MYHNIRPLEQFIPARAKKKVEVHELGKRHELFGWEQKIDGERFTIHTYNPTDKYLHGITSRCISKITGRLCESTDKVPHLSNHPELPEDSRFDNEFVSQGDIILVDLPGKFWDKLSDASHPHMMWLKSKFQGALPVYPSVSNTSSILGSLGPEAIRKQEERGLIQSYCFDVTKYKGKSALHLAQSQRRKALATILEPINPDLGLILMPQWVGLTTYEIVELFNLVVEVKVNSSGDCIKGEGLIGKDQTQVYNGPNNWFKLKADYPADVVCTGDVKVGEEGKTGQMLGMASALSVGVYDKGLLHHVGWVSAIMDGHHNLMPAEEAKSFYKGKVMEVRHNELQKDLDSPIGVSLRHPRFRRWRDDKNAEDCTLSAMKVECKVT